MSSNIHAGVFGARSRLGGVLLAVALALPFSVSGASADDLPPVPVLEEVRVLDGDVVQILYHEQGNAPARPWGIRFNIYVGNELVDIGGTIPLPPDQFDHRA